MNSTCRLPLYKSKTLSDKEALLDCAVADKLRGYRLILSKTGYVSFNKNGQTIPLHRMVMDAKTGETVDHIDRDPLNNTAANLRIASKQLNLQNTAVKGKTSRFRGVTKWKGENHGAKDRWICSLSKRSFLSEQHAAYSYNVAARKKWGEGACVNDVAKPDDWDSLEDVKTRRPRGLGTIQKTRNGRFRAILRVDKKLKTLGTFATIEDADYALASAQAKPESASIADAPRNSAGHAFIRMPCGEDVIMDDDTWLTYSTCDVRKGLGGYPFVFSRVNKKLHRLVISAEEGDLIDHINKNKLDARRSNLRRCSNAQNSQNKTTTNLLGRGVAKQGDLYSLVVTCRGQPRRIGTFLTQEMAAWVGDQFTKHIYGEHAHLNGTSQPLIITLSCFKDKRVRYTEDRDPHLYLNPQYLKDELTRIESREYKRLYRGVSEVSSGKFIMQIAVNGKRKQSTHDTAEEAARAYDVAAKLLFGSYATLNFPV
jgi:hypothetical protein